MGRYGRTGSRVVSGDQRVVAVALGEFDDRQRPDDVEPGIEGVERAFSVRTIGGGVQIKQFTVVGEGLKSVGQALRDQQGLVVVGAQDGRVPAQKSPGALAQVHRDIEHLAAQTAHELGLGMGWILKVQATHRAAPAVRL